MNRGSRLLRLSAGLAALLLGASAASASSFQVLLNFNGANGITPQAVTVDPSSGKLYVPTYEGTSEGNGGGDVIQLTPPSGSEREWQPMNLHVFGVHDRSAGFRPESKIVLGANGVLYGTTSGAGGPAGCYGSCTPPGQGAVFSLTPTGDGTGYTFARLYLFRGGARGANPASSPVMGANGVLYGATKSGGNTQCADGAGGGCGVIYALMPPGQVTTTWTEVIIHTFQGGKDGVNPNNELTIGPDGSFYGTTAAVGDSYGTVFRMIPPVAGKHGWVHQVLYTFTGNRSSGSYPISDLVFDNAGNLYGVCEGGGPGDGTGNGFVYKLTPSPTEYGRWKITSLHSFATDGAGPSSGPVFDSKGNLYGLTGSDIYELTPTTSGQWTETVVETSGAAFPSFLTIDSSDTLYGVNSQGGTSNDGYVFKITP